MIWITLFAFPLLALLFFIRINASKKKKKIRLEIESNWGLEKEEVSDFNLIAKYSIGINPIKVSNDNYLSDLDFEKLFNRIDRTNTRPGQQFLYNSLRSNYNNQDHLIELENRIKKLHNSETIKEDIQERLQPLNSNDAYYISDIFTKTQKNIFPNFAEAYIRVAGIIILILSIELVIRPKTLIVCILLLMLAINFFIHLFNKRFIGKYTHSIPQLLNLNKTASWLIENHHIENTDVNIESYKKVKKLCNSLGLVNLQRAAIRDPTEILYLISEWINIFLLVEPLVFVLSIPKVNKYANDIRKIYELVAEIDVAISVMSLRAGLAYYCLPKFIPNAESMMVEDLYHPLVDNCISNSIITEKNSGVLITGSNMSGKTTFIRAIGCNALIAQTLNTSFSNAYEAPFLRILTSINIKDDLSENKSYFQSEALSILDIVKKGNEEGALKSLIIIDEVFKGTNTIERISAAKAVLSYLIKRNNLIFVSTHDMELATLLNDYVVYSFEELVAENQLVFDYKIKKGKLKKQNGIAVLSFIGFPKEIIDEAYNIDAMLRNKYLVN